jgi:hypothetical protein
LTAASSDIADIADISTIELFPITS